MNSNFGSGPLAEPLSPLLGRASVGQNHLGGPPSGGDTVAKYFMLLIAEGALSGDTFTDGFPGRTGALYGGLDGGIGVG